MTIKQSIAAILVIAAASAGSIWGYAQYQENKAISNHPAENISLFKKPDFIEPPVIDPEVDFEKAATKAVPSVVHITTISFHEIRLEPDAQRVTVSGKPVTLTEKEYQLLEYFIANHRRVLTKAAIAAHNWGDEYEQVSNYDFIYTHIKNLRKKLMDAGAVDYIKTVHGVGYRFTDL